MARTPAHGAGPLTLSLSLSGDVHARASEGGRGLALKGAGGHVVYYRALAATDARGRALHAWLSVRGSHVFVRVDARGARYPLTIDPLIQQGSPLTDLGGEGEVGDGAFGASIALSWDGRHRPRRRAPRVQPGGRRVRVRALGLGMGAAGRAQRRRQRGARTRRIRPERRVVRRRQHGRDGGAPRRLGQGRRVGVRARGIELDGADEARRRLHERVRQPGHRRDGERVPRRERRAVLGRQHAPRRGGR